METVGFVDSAIEDLEAQFELLESSYKKQNEKYHKIAMTVEKVLDRHRGLEQFKFIDSAIENLEARYELLESSYKKHIEKYDKIVMTVDIAQRIHNQVIKFLPELKLSITEFKMSIQLLKLALSDKDMNVEQRSRLTAIWEKHEMQFDQVESWWKRLDSQAVKVLNGRTQAA